MSKKAKSMWEQIENFKKNKPDEIRQATDGLSEQMLLLYEIVTIRYAVANIHAVFDELRQDLRKKR